MFLGRHTALPWLFDGDGYRGIELLAELGGCPPNLIVVGDRRRVARILRRLDDATQLADYAGELHGELARGRVDLGVGRAGRTPVMVVETQMGGSATEIIIREVIDRTFHPKGAKAIIRVGSCGTLGEPDHLPQLAIAGFASGWSGAVEQWQRGVLSVSPEHSADTMHKPPAVECPAAVVAALEEAARQLDGATWKTGGVFSKDSLYSEQDERFAGILAELDCVATEMELATIGPIAEHFGVPWGGIMASAGRVPDGPWYEPDEIEQNENLAIDVALAALRALAGDT